VPPLQVLAETKIKSVENGNMENTREIAQVLLEAGMDPASRGDYESAPYFAVNSGAVETARVPIQFLKNQRKSVTGGIATIGATRQNNGIYGGHSSDVFYSAARSENPEMLPIVYDILEDELHPENSSLSITDRKAIDRRIESVRRLLKPGATSINLQSWNEKRL
jgi:hypothetical protein